MLSDLRLERRKRLGNYRFLRKAVTLTDFASNDYLGLARSPVLKEAVLKAWAGESLSLNGLGSTGSRLLTGNCSYAEELEHIIARYHGFDAALLYHCGYMANLGLLSSVSGEDDIIFFDEQIHASMRDGMRLCRAAAYPFKHHDLEHLEKRLKTLSCRGSRFVCVESVYSMDGSIAPLKELSALCHHYEALLIVDEAHAFGVFGAEGKGLVAQLGLTDEIFALVVTFGKALGTFGAAVLGGQQLKEHLINFSRPFMYSTALPLHNLMAIRCAYALLPELSNARARLLARIAQFGRARVSASPSAIQTIRSNANVRQMAYDLAQKGYAVNALMNPTVRQGHECLRISLHAYNTEEELNGLLACI